MSVCLCGFMNKEKGFEERSLGSGHWLVGKLEEEDKKQFKTYRSHFEQKYK